MINYQTSDTSEFRFGSLVKIRKNNGEVGLSNVPVVREVRYCVLDATLAGSDGYRKNYGSSETSLALLSSDLPFLSIGFAFHHISAFYYFDGQLNFYNSGTLLGSKSILINHDKTTNTTDINSNFPSYNWCSVRNTKVTKNIGLDLDGNATYGVQTSKTQMRGDSVILETTYNDPNTLTITDRIRCVISMQPFKMCVGADEVKLKINFKKVETVNMGQFGLGNVTGGGITACIIHQQNTPFAL